MITDPSRMATKEELESLKIQPATLIDCPVYKEDLARIKAKKVKDFENLLPEQLNRLMNYKRIEAADIHKATGISHSTLSEWICGKVRVQLLDDNIKKIARYFDCSIDFLVYATPRCERDIELDDIMPGLDDKFQEVRE
jgi:DNA-binding Xre family transcriptional regulator